ncbi:MAG: beta-N-acetylhexosaminidase [Candidatus Poriferisodalaceae bacterium]|jgi:beta-N-acetylhexosaminidase
MPRARRAFLASAVGCASLVLLGTAVLAIVGGAPAAAQESEPAVEPPVPVVAVLEGPGGRGYWLVSADGHVEVAGTNIVPSLGAPPELLVRVETARAGAPGALGLWLVLADGTEVALGDPGPEIGAPTDRPVGWLTGVGLRQLLRGNWWPDIDLACTAELPRPVRVGQTIMLSLTERQFGLAVEEARDHQIAGVMMLGAASPFIDVRITEMQDFAGLIPLMIAVDEEGGRIQRLRGILPTLPAAAEQVGERADVVQARFNRHGIAMSALGFTVNFAPVVDVGAGPGIGDRVVSDDPATVEAVSMQVIDGLATGGVLPVVKHFPGHGGASADSHDELPTTASIDALRLRDLLPFQAAIDDGRSAVMVGHLSVPGLTDGDPASLSEAAITGLLRGELGHDGLVVTDSLTMGAIQNRHSTSEAVELALRAGADLALVGGLDDLAPALARIDDAVVNGRLSVERLNEAATHVLRAKGVNACTLIGRV